MLPILSAANVWAQDSELEDLREQNTQLAERVRRLEEASLQESVEKYLERSEIAQASEGAGSILPGGLRLRVSGQVRVREEVKDRLYSPADSAGDRSFDFTGLKTRLRFDIDVSEDVTVVIAIQDLRNFGGAGSTTAITSGLDLNKGYIEFKKLGGDERFSLELGRFVMFYGDHRVIGHLEWLMGRMYDGLRARFSGGKDAFWLDFFAVRVRETVFPDDDQWFAGFYGGRGIFEAYLFLFTDDLPGTGELGTAGDTQYVVAGARVHGKPGNFDYSVEGMFQGAGEVRGDDITAFGVVLAGGFTFKDSGTKPRVGIVVAWGTGDQNPTDGETEQLQTLFPTNHLHYGGADLVGWSNILNIELNFRLKPSERTAIVVELHHFERPEATGAWVNAGGGAIRSGAAGTSGHLGNEIDLVFTFKPSKQVNAQVGYSIFLPGDFVQQTGSDPVGHFFYVQVLVKF